MFTPVILAGGTGSRLWPLSRSHFPKQFLQLDDKHTLLQQTILRLGGLAHAKPLFICHEEHRFVAAEQIRQLNLKQVDILLEPAGRNTAPAIALAAMRVAAQGNANALLLVQPADHVIADVKNFQQVIRQACSYAEEGYLVTFGIVPTSAETGYGYIRRAAAVANAFSVGQFVEKPDFNTAKHYVQTGEYYWNSGIFMFRADVYLDQLKQFRPDIYACCQAAIAEQVTDLDFIRINTEAFLACPAESVDYAIMEHTAKAIVLPLDAGWSDVGGYNTLWQYQSKDDHNNVIKGDVMTLDTHNCYLHSDDKLVSTLGVQDLIVVSTKDAVLVAHKDKAQQIKELVNQLEQAGRVEAASHRVVYRPWGIYDCVDMGERFKVKRITVNPGAKLSLQMHHHRAEHWIVVAGTALVTIDGESQFISENQSVYIPIAAVHALENPGKVSLKLIEVQSGAYLSEDDIVRFEDNYGRV